MSAVRNAENEDETETFSRPLFLALERISNCGIADAREEKKDPVRSKAQFSELNLGEICGKNRHRRG